MLTKQLAEKEQSIGETKKKNETVSASVSEEKLSPNCTIVEKQYFNGCDHLIKDIKDIPEGWVNMTKQELNSQIETEYQNWSLEDFSSNQIIVSCEKEGYCSKHYVIREHDGVIAIYTLNENGEETWKENTEIVTMYLPEEDIERLKEGIKVVGDDKLHAVLEDFE